MPDISKASIALAGVTAAVALLGKAIGSAMEKQKSLAEFSAITGVTGASLERFGAAAEELSLKFGGTAVQNIEMFKGVLSRLGPGFAQSEEAVRSIGDSINTLGKAAGLDAPESMDALTTAMLQFGVDLKDPLEAANKGAEMMNVMAAGAKFGAAEIPQVSEALKQVGVTAKGLGQSFESTNAELQVLAAGGKFGSEAGVALRNVMASITSVSGPAEKGLAAYGLSSAELASVMTDKGLNEALKMLKDGLEKSGSASQDAALLTKLFGKENMAAAQVLLDNTAMADELTLALTGTSTAYDQASTVMNTAEGNMEILNAQIDALITLFGEQLLPFVNEGISTFVGIGGAVFDFINAMKSGDVAGMARGWADAWTGSIKVMTFGVVDLTDALGEQAKSELELVKMQKETTQKQLDRHQSNLKLIESYEQIFAGSEKSKVSEKQRRETLVKIAQEYPGIIKAGGDYAQNLRDIRQAGDEARGKIAELNGKMQELSKTQVEATKRMIMTNVQVIKDEIADVLGPEGMERFTKGVRQARTEADILEALTREQINISNSTKIEAKDRAALAQQLQKLADLRTQYITAGKEEAKVQEVVNTNTGTAIDLTKESKKEKEKEFKDRKVGLDILHDENKALEEQRKALQFLAGIINTGVSPKNQLSETFVGPDGILSSIDASTTMLDDFALAWEEVGFTIADVGGLFNTAFSGGEDAFKGVLKTILNAGIDFLQAELAIAAGYATIKALLTSGISAIADAPLTVAAYAALEAARGMVNSFAIGTPFVPRNQLAFLHEKEAVLNPTQAEEWRRDQMGKSRGEKNGALGRKRQTIEGKILVSVDQFAGASNYSEFQVMRSVM